jgi:hypothetical protein
MLQVHGLGCLNSAFLAQQCYGVCRVSIATLHDNHQLYVSCWLTVVLKRGRGERYPHCMCRCVDLLVSAGRVPEAAFFTRTYLPSRITEVRLHPYSVERTLMAEVS